VIHPGLDHPAGHVDGLGTAAGEERHETIGEPALSEATAVWQ
jgi:hypothetical protein